MYDMIFFKKSIIIKVSLVKYTFFHEIKKNEVKLKPKEKKDKKKKKIKIIKT